MLPDNGARGLETEERADRAEDRLMLNSPRFSRAACNSAAIRSSFDASFSSSSSSSPSPSPSSPSPSRSSSSNSIHESVSKNTRQRPCPLALSTILRRPWIDNEPRSQFLITILRCRSFNTQCASSCSATAASCLRRWCSLTQLHAFRRYSSDLVARNKENPESRTRTNERTRALTIGLIDKRLGMVQRSPAQSLHITAQQTKQTMRK